MCMDLLKSLGFANVESKSGPGGGDLGIDIEMVEPIILKTGKQRLEKIMVQCKNYQSKNIGYSEIVSIIAKARNLDFDRLLIITSSELGAQAKQAIVHAANNKAPVEVTYWDKSALEDLLEVHRQVHEKYFLPKPDKSITSEQIERLHFPYVLNPAKAFDPLAIKRPLAEYA
jgi:hypothetical protein